MSFGPIGPTLAYMLSGRVFKNGCFSYPRLKRTGPFRSQPFKPDSQLYLQAKWHFLSHQNYRTHEVYQQIQRQTTQIITNFGYGYKLVLLLVQEIESFYNDQSHTRPPLLKAKSEATMETGITNTSHPMQERIIYFSKLAFHHNIISNLVAKRISSLESIAIYLSNSD